jgi:hypothetical protein
VLAADPYRFFQLPNSITTEAVQKQYAAPANPAFYAFTKYAAERKPDIVLGDSRIALLAPHLTKEKTGRDIASLAIPGGTFETTLDAYWLATEWTKLRSVTMAVAFDTYNDFRIGSEIGAVRSINENPLLYFTNRNVIDASLEAYKQRLGFRVSNQYQLTGMSEQQIWEAGRTFYVNSLRNWRYPVRHKARLEEVVAHCKANGTELKFVILPQHDEASSLIEDHGLTHQYQTMKKDLANLAPLVDLSNRSAFTADRRYFTDMLHFNHVEDFQLIAQIWK